jgi:dephospho-CoA kinase
MIIIGITGTDGAGKGAVVDYLVTKKSFAHYSARALFVSELEKRGLPTDRAHMRIMANELRRTHGNEYLVREALARARAHNDGRIIIESIRASAEVDALHQERGILFAVDADPHVRYERIQKRASETDRISFDAFIQHEQLEMNDPDPNGMQKAATMKAADYTFQNNGTVEELHAQIDEALKKFGIA